MRVAVIGGGLFGATAAIHAARAGYHVELFEKSDGLLQAASGINQFRLHAGYHYPRSGATIWECQTGLQAFQSEYGDALIHDGRQHYAIAQNGSQVSVAEYLQTCARHDLPFLAVPSVSDALGVTIRVNEPRIDPNVLRSDIVRKLAAENVWVHLNTIATRSMRERFDKIIIAGYASANVIAAELGCPVRIYQFEVIEKPVIRLPAAYRDFSIVVMDGPFCCVDPFANTGLHLMGHVVHAIHATNTGVTADVPDHLRVVLNKGIVQDVSFSHFDRFRSDGMKYLPFLEEAAHVGSMFTVRAVLPYRDHDDARPTLVEPLDDQCLSIFSGKLGTAVTAAHECVTWLGTSHNKTDDPALLAG